MKLSNIRKIDLVNGDGSEVTRLVCDVHDCPFSESKQLYYEVPRSFSEWLSVDVYDSFMVALLFPIMRRNELLEINGKVSKKLYLNLMYEVSASLRDFDNTLYLPQIKVEGYADAAKNKQQHVGTGFAGGVDSFTVIHDHYWHPVDMDNKIDAIFWFHVDNFGNPLDSNCLELVKKNYNFIAKAFAEKAGIEFVCFEDSNMFEFCPPYATDLKMGFLARISMILSLQRGLKCFYVATDLSYGQSLQVQDMYRYQPIYRRYWDYGAASYACPMLSPKNLDIVSDGSRYTRGDKLELIIDDPFVKEILNVCCSLEGIGKNCSKCRKCRLTMLAIDILGKLDAYKDIFDIEYYEKHKYGIKCHASYYNTKEEYSMIDMELAQKYNYPMPSKFEASLYICATKIYSIFKLNKIKKLFKKNK